MITQQQNYNVSCADRQLSLCYEQPAVMGVLNITPDSFSDGGNYLVDEKIQKSAVCHAIEAMIQAGATIIDIGGESTRPGAAVISPEQEAQRVLPVLEWVKDISDLLISVDTSNPVIIKEADKLGAHIINDVRALTRVDAMQAAVDSRLAVCLMHMQGQPISMQESPTYQDVVAEVYGFLSERVDACIKHGIDKHRLIIDPGFGFGKTLNHNLALMQGLTRFAELDLPILVGVSRKRMIGEILNRPVEDRLIGSIAAAIYAYLQGALIIRAHDVKETVDAITMIQKLTDSERHANLAGEML